MKRLVLFCCGWMLCLLAFAGGRVDTLLTLLKSNAPGYVFVVAHRGGWRLAPENSVAAIEQAVAMGCDMVEIDIQKTKEGNFILMHDGRIDWTTDGKGEVKDYTVEELKTFRLRRSDGTLSEERIPTLKEALLACKGRLLVNIDKGGDYLADIEPIIRETGTENHVVLKGRNPVDDVVRQLSEYDEIIYMPVVDLDAEGAIPYVDSFLTGFHPRAVELIFKTDDFPALAYAEQILAAGCRVWINALWASLCGGHEDEKAMNDPDANWGWVLEKGATIIQTDRPVELIDYLKSKGLRNISADIVR